MAERGHEGIVKMLLEREEVNPDQEDTDHGQSYSRWPLSVAMLELRVSGEGESIRNRQDLPP